MNKKIFNFSFCFLFLTILVFAFYTKIYAEDEIPESEPLLTANFIVRNGDGTLYSGSVPLPASGTVSINDANGVAHSIDAQSVLAILKNINDASDAFSISNLQYFDSFGAFYLKCLLPNGGEDLCENWQYAVGNFTPSSSIDTTILSGGETVGIYFGTSHRLVLGTNSITTGESLSATAERYDYENNIWNPLTGVNIGVTLPNPDDPFNPTVVSTHGVDASGIASITITGANTYTLGIVEDFYFPSYIVTVGIAIEGGGGSGGGGNTAPPQTFDVQKALAYLKSAQSPDGSFGGSLLYTDWAGVALGALDVGGSSKNTLIAYLGSHNSLSSLLTDNERRAMALLALHQNPYSFNGENYIKAITDSFDGTQFGDTDLINDDIFALIPLKNAGYTASDSMIIKDIAFLISKQKNNGSWEESVDITAASISALKSFKSVSGVSDSLSKATDYLLSKQNNDGGWENSIFSTSWAMQAMNALGTTWTKGGHTPEDYFGEQQEEDGAVLPSSDTLKNRIWATSYAIAAASEKSWNEIMQSVSKPADQNNNQNNSNDDREDREDETETIDSQTLTNPVVCPIGDLFNTTTGEACTEFTPINSSIPLLQNPKVATIPKTQKPKTIVLQDLPTNTNMTAIEPDTLTATVVNALPAQAGLPIEETPHKIPIVLGALSGIVLLYIALKFFIK